MMAPVRGAAHPLPLELLQAISSCARRRVASMGVSARSMLPTFVGASQEIAASACALGIASRNVSMSQ
jgi:hypothetical protein